MIELLLTVVPSILWLLYRCVKLFQVPVEEIIDDLNIDIPHIANICIDSVSCNTIVIHWDVEMKPYETLYYILLVNGKEVATISSTDCKFCDLEPESLYQIQVIAVNSVSNFRSQSHPVYIETNSEEVWDIVEEICHQEECQEVKRGQEETVDLESLGLDDKNVSLATIDEIKNETVLRDYLHHYQLQLSNFRLEFKHIRAHFADEFNALKQENLALMEASKAKQAMVHKNASILKEFQKRKEDLLLTKSKLTNQLNESKKFIDNKSKNYQSLVTELSQLKTKKTHLLENKENEVIRLTEQVHETSLEIENHKIKYQNLEDTVKNLKNERKSVVKAFETLKKLVDEFNESCFNKDYSINHKGMEILSELCKHKPNWNHNIYVELKQLNEFDQAWKTTFKTEIKHFVNSQNLVETIKAKQPDYSPSYTTDYQASLRFGGGNNVISKKRRNRSNSKPQSQPTFSTSPNSMGANSLANYEPYNQVATPQVTTPQVPGEYNFNNYYGGIYNEDLNDNSRPYDTNYNPVIDSPDTNYLNQSVSPNLNANLVPSISVDGWNNVPQPQPQPQPQVAQVSVPQVPQVSVPQVPQAPPDLGDDLNQPLLDILNQNLSSTSLNNQRYSSNIWNGLNHTRSISGSNIWTNNVNTSVNLNGSNGHLDSPSQSQSLQGQSLQGQTLQGQTLQGQTLQGPSLNREQSPVLAQNQNQSHLMQQVNNSSSSLPATQPFLNLNNPGFSLDNFNQLNGLSPSNGSPPLLLRNSPLGPQLMSAMSPSQFSNNYFLLEDERKRHP